MQIQAKRIIAAMKSSAQNVIISQQWSIVKIDALVVGGKTYVRFLPRERRSKSGIARLWFPPAVNGYDVASRLICACDYGNGFLRPPLKLV